ncbi:hypothetical protein JOF56_007299 [Kibdelosporangium banguiense]|uniref:Uncharacterized protein n=1 Tax=Kibdelosporangium banguiense TaxID=1365924 RepID=A0ABS4TR73_9PSEU|nr:hypothetical protein [Kibdelosporangium banguiense]MBP2326914.1 hypothetical protein [Kibdelosporangium banguiense]
MSISDSFADWRAHRTVRADAERRRSSAQHEFNRHQRQAKRDLRAVRRSGKTAAIVARSRLVELGVQGLGRIRASLRG